MKRRTWARLMAAVTAVVMTLLCVPGALAAKKKAANFGGLNDNVWYYVPETVPRDYLTEVSGNTVSMYDKDWNNREEADTLTVEFASGDEHLKDAVRTEKGETHVRENDELVTREVERFVVDLSGVTAPGQAVFHVHAESSSYTLETDYTLRVLSWEEHPLFTPNPDDSPITLAMGATLQQEELFAALMESHAGEIGETVLGLEGVPPFANYISLRDPETGEYVQTDVIVIGATDQEEPTTAVVLYDSPWGGYTAYEFRDFGTYTLTAGGSFGNIEYRPERIIAVLPYEITGVGGLAPGASKQLAVNDRQEGSGRTFTITAEGEGISFDPETGTLTAAEDAVLGNTFTVTATPSDGGYAVTAQGTISDGATGSEKFEMKELGEGFTVPMLSSEDGKFESFFTYSNQMISRNTSEVPYKLYQSATYYEEGEFMETREAALDSYYEYLSSDSLENAEEEILEIDGRPCLIMTAIYNDPSDGSRYYFGLLRYSRNNILVQMQLYSYPGEGGTFENLPRITRTDLVHMAEMIQYDPSKASITVDDGAITVSAKDGENVVSGGKKLKLTADFASPDKVNKKAKNNTVNWSVLDVNTQQAPENVKIDKNGNLSVGAKLEEVLQLEVKASSPVFHTEATYQVTAIPALKKITLEPAELFFYTGAEAPQTVKALMEPATVPAVGLTWSAGKKEIVEITAADDGTAEIRPLKAGKVTVTVKAPGGKSAKLNVNTVEPVTGLELAVKGAAKPGKTVTVSAALEPKNAGNKALEWSVDVGEDVAAITQKGQVKIAKTAEAGTVITVTCRALGAPEPIEKTIEITVE